MENTFKDEAIVLKKTEVGDTDLSITVYMKNSGKENIYIPKGQIIKTFIPTATEPFNWFKGVFTKRKEKVFIKEIDNYKNLALEVSKDIDRFYTAFFILDKFNKYVLFSDERLFILLKKSLYYLLSTKDTEIFKTNFLAKLVYLSGIYPETKNCVVCKVHINKGNYGSFSIEKSGVLCKKCSQRNKSFLSYEDLKSIQILKKIPFNKLDSLNKINNKKLQIFFAEYLDKKL